MGVALLGFCYGVCWSVVCRAVNGRSLLWMIQYASHSVLWVSIFAQKQLLTLYMQEC